MLIFTNKIRATSARLPLLAALLMSGCAQLHDFSMEQSYQQVKQVQILDPGAPERNEGIVLSLDGNYGYEVMKAYQKSNSLPATARGTIKGVGIN